MFKKILYPAFFVLLIAAQWYVPTDMVLQSSNVLAKGELMRFKCAPIDPQDPFRGSYIVLQLDNRDFPLPANHTFQSGDRVYISFGTDSAGYATIKAISANKPTQMLNILETKIDYISNEDNKPVATLDFPFTRFYMDEFKAPKAEKLYNDAMLTDSTRTYAIVYIYNGKARISNVVVKGRLITDWMLNKPPNITR